MWTILMVLAIVVLVVLPGLKARSMPVKKLLIAPAVFMYLLYDTATRHFVLDNTSYLIIALGIIAGTAIGVLVRMDMTITADPINHQINLPGSRRGLVVFGVIFAVHFAIGYLKATHPHFFTSVTAPQLSLLFLLALVSSLTVGISGCLYYKYRQAIAI